MSTKEERSRWPVRKLRLEDEGKAPDVLSLTPSERVAMVWPLTLQAWGFKEGVAEATRVRRDIVRTIRNQP